MHVCNIMPKLEVVKIVLQVAMQFYSHDGLRWVVNLSRCGQSLMMVVAMFMRNF